MPVEMPELDEKLVDKERDLGQRAAPHINLDSGAEESEVRLREHWYQFWCARRFSLLVMVCSPSRTMNLPG